MQLNYKSSGHLKFTYI